MLSRLMITPQNFWIFFGGLWLFVGGTLLISGVAIFMYHYLADQSTGVEEAGDLTLAGGIIAGVGGTLVFAAFRKRKLDEALRRTGVRAEGTITDIARSNLRINGVQQWVIRYSYRDAHGAGHHGSRDVVPEEALRWRVGQTVDVRYDAGRPQLNVWIAPY